MEDEVDRLVHLVVRRDVEHLEAEAPVADVVDVLERAGVEAVHADHPVAAREQEVAEVGAEEPGTARDERGRHAGQGT